MSSCVASPSRGRGGRGPGLVGAMACSRACAPRSASGWRPTTRPSRSGRLARPRCLSTIPSTRTSPTRTATTWPECSGCAKAKRSLSVTGPGAGPDDGGRWAQTPWPRSVRRADWGATAPSRSKTGPNLPSPWRSRRPRGSVPNGWSKNSPSSGSIGIVPLISERSVVRPKGERGEAMVARLRRVAREAAAQCRRVWLPNVTDLIGFADLPALGVPEAWRSPN